MTNEVFPTSAPEVSTASQNTVRTAQDDGDLSYKVILVPIDFSEGSTAERVVEHAPCPVLVVKERYLSA
jgi:hypothetical protein